MGMIKPFITLLESRMREPEVRDTHGGRGRKLLPSYKARELQRTGWERDADQVALQGRSRLNPSGIQWQPTVERVVLIEDRFNVERGGGIFLQVSGKLEPGNLLSNKKEEVESFWLMGNDSRKERKLPSTFDRKVYDVLEESEKSPPASRLALIECTEDPETLERNEIVLVKQEEAEAIFYSNKPASTEDGLFSDFEQSSHEDIEKSPEKETVISENLIRTIPAPGPVSADTGAEKLLTPNPSRISTTPDRLKRRRLSSDGCCRTDTENRLIKVLEKNGELLNRQLEHRNFNCQVDRDQRDEQTKNLVAAVSKLTDAILRIADKL